ncbi:MAG TPA: FG-GAP-like repeat-containing protein [Nocardioides sp.]|nr:FG-GAP-like repeat-containing protein [Nocardioides sp.]
MRPFKAHFVTSCQQLLALGAVLAVLTPAASVVSLDVINTPGGPTAGDPGSTPEEGPVRRAHPAVEAPPAPDPGESRVPAARVPAEVAEVRLTPPARTASATEPAPRAREPRHVVEASDTTVVSEPQPVDGYGAVGITWSHQDQVEEEDLELQVRTSTAGRWTGWSDLEYHDDHAPDPTSEEGQDARPGTDPLLVGEVDLVQARAVAAHRLPRDLSLAVVTPGTPSATTTQAPELTSPPSAASEAEDASAGESLELQAASSAAPQPTIYSRKQWGADERMRDGRPSYGTISAGFVHHTVNGNDYTRAEVPGILRSIYAYHTRSRGWSDIGYNFLVDKFGRIWEGRAGGIARPVVGAHTYGYNGDSFAMSAIGNFETVRPPDAMLRAYGSLFAWKLGLHGIDPLDTSQNVSGTVFKAINGHRDAGSTACPGRYLYDRLPAIRRYAADVEDAPTTPEVELGQVDSDLVGTPHPDLVVRRSSDGRGVLLPTGGLASFLRPAELAAAGWRSREFLATPDLTGDGRVDLVTFDAGGSLEIRPGSPTGAFAEVSRRSRRFRGHDLVASTGDLDGNGRADLVARGEGRLVTFLRTRRGAFRAVGSNTGLRGYRQLVGAGDVTGDGRPDLWGRDRRGRLFLHRGLGGGAFEARAQVAGDWTGFDWLVGGVDYTGDAVPDLVARRTDGALMVLPSRGHGTLGRALGPVRGSDGLTMITGAGQVTGNEAPDLLAARSDGALVVVENRGTFNVGRPVDTGQSFSRGNLLLNAGDFDGDGHGDVILRRRVGSLWLYRGNGAGRLAAPVWIGGKRPFRKVSDLRVVPDVTGDDRYDVVGRAAGGKPMVWPGNGDGRLGTGYAVRIVGDRAPAVDLSGYDWVVEVSDLRRRGPADLVVRDRSGYLYRLDGRRRGFRGPHYLGEGTKIYDLAG